MIGSSAVENPDQRHGRCIGLSRSLRDQCAMACVAFLHKQNGEFVSVSEVEGPGKFFVFQAGQRFGVSANAPPAACSTAYNTMGIRHETFWTEEEKKRF